MELHGKEERICRELGDVAGLGIGLQQHAECLLSADRPGEALPLIEESMGIAEKLGSPALEGRRVLREQILRATTDTQGSEI
jgi:hypothetical protein